MILNFLKNTRYYYTVTTNGRMRCLKITYMNKIRDHYGCIWEQFVLVDCLCYIQLYAAISNGDWELRTSALKSMAPLFIAFDQDVYMHNCCTTSIKTWKYALNVKSRWVHYKCDWCIVAIDKAHEMKINKDLKSGVIRLTANYLLKS